MLPPLSSKITASSFVLPEISISFPHTCAGPLYWMVCLCEWLSEIIVIFWGHVHSHTTPILFAFEILWISPDSWIQKSYIKPHCFGWNCNFWLALWCNNQLWACVCLWNLLGRNSGEPGIVRGLHKYILSTDWRVPLCWGSIIIGLPDSGDAIEHLSLFIDPPAPRTGSIVEWRLLSECLRF